MMTGTLRQEDALPGTRVSIVDLTDPRNICSDNLMGTITEVSGLKVHVDWDDEKAIPYARWDGRWYWHWDLWPVGD